MKLEIKRSNSGENTISGILPAAAHVIGKPLMVTSIDASTGAKTFALADGRCDGFMTRESRVPTTNDAPAINGNPRTAEEQLMGWGMEVPFTAGREGSIEQADWVEAEGADYILKSGTGSLASATVDMEVSFGGAPAGRFYEAQTGDTVQFRVAKVMTAEESGDVRILFQRTGEYIKA